MTKSKKSLDLAKQNQHLGRFAPSPTGGLHFGSLVAACASYLQAKAKNGQWRLRIEDLDPPREELGAKDKILKTLEAYRLFWDGKIVYQSNNLDLYAQAATELKNKNLSFNCACSRNNLKQHKTYPGFCKDKNLKPKNTAVRLKTNQTIIEIDDLVQGVKQWNLATEIGDFIIKRKDGLFAYQLAVVVDDAALGVTEIIRGMDLIDETPKQVYLQSLMEINTPSYGHVPLVTHKNGDKLSKQTHAPELKLDKKSISQSIFEALVFLGQKPPLELTGASADELWKWGVMNWDIDNVRSL